MSTHELSHGGDDTPPTPAGSPNMPRMVRPREASTYSGGSPQVAPAPRSILPEASPATHRGVAHHARNLTPTALPTPWYISAARIMLIVTVLAVFAEAFADLLPDAPLFSFITPLRALLGVGLVAAIVARPKWQTFSTAIDLPILGLVGCSMAYIVLGRGVGSSWRALVTAVLAYYLIVALRRALDNDATSVIMTTCLFAGAFAGLLVMTDLNNGVQTEFCRVPWNPANNDCDAPGAISRAQGPFSNPNLLAAFLLVMIPLSLPSAITARGLAHKTLAWSAVFLSVAAFFLTMSRTAILAIVPMAVCFLLLSKPTKNRIRLFVWGAAGTALLLIAFTFTQASTLFGSRTDLYHGAWRIIARHPEGVGIGRAGAVLQAELPGQEPFAHAHNLWLNWLLELGPVGLTMWLIIPLLAMWRTVRACIDGDTYAPFIATALVGILVASFADHPANVSRIAYMVWATLALSMTCGHHGMKWLPLPNALARRFGQPSAGEESAPATHTPSGPPASHIPAGAPAAASQPLSPAPVASSPSPEAPSTAAPKPHAATRFTAPPPSASHKIASPFGEAMPAPHDTVTEALPTTSATDPSPGVRHTSPPPRGNQPTTPRPPARRTQPSHNWWQSDPGRPTTGNQRSSRRGNLPTPFEPTTQTPTRKRQTPPTERSEDQGR